MRSTQGDFCVLTHNVLQLSFFFFISAMFLDGLGKVVFVFSSFVPQPACDQSKFIFFLNICHQDISKIKQHQRNF